MTEFLVFTKTVVCIKLHFVKVMDIIPKNRQIKTVNIFENLDSRLQKY